MTDSSETASGVRRLKVMEDYHCWPIWEDGDVGNVDPRTLPISAALQERLMAWACEYDAILNQEDPASSGFPSETAEAHFEAEGRTLATALQEELGETVAVRYWRDPS